MYSVKWLWKTKIMLTTSERVIVAATRATTIMISKIAKIMIMIKMEDVC